MCPSNPVSFAYIPTRQCIYACPSGHFASDVGRVCMNLTCPTTPFFYYRDYQNNHCVLCNNLIIQNVLTLILLRFRVRVALKLVHMDFIRIWELWNARPVPPHVSPASTPTTAPLANPIFTPSSEPVSPLVLLSQSITTNTTLLFHASKPVQVLTSVFWVQESASWLALAHTIKMRQHRVARPVQQVATDVTQQIVRHASQVTFTYQNTVHVLRCAA